MENALPAFTRFIRERAKISPAWMTFTSIARTTMGDGLINGDGLENQRGRMDLENQSRTLRLLITTTVKRNRVAVITPNLAELYACQTNPTAHSHYLLGCTRAFCPWGDD